MCPSRHHVDPQHAGVLLQSVIPRWRPEAFCNNAGEELFSMVNQRS